MCFHNALSLEAVKIENRFNALFDKKIDFTPIYHANAFSFPLWLIIINLKLIV